MRLIKEVDESGAEVFTVLLPSGTPLPARRHHTMTGAGKLSSLCLEIYQGFVMEQPEKLAKVEARSGIQNYGRLFQTWLWGSLLIVVSAAPYCEIITLRHITKRILFNHYCLLEPFVMCRSF